MNKQQTIDLLKQQLPSFYSLEQVIEIISKIEEPKTSVLTDNLIKRIVDVAKDAIDSAISDIDFTDCDCEFEFRYGNEVGLSSIDVDTTSIVDDVARSLRDELNDLKDELEAKEEEVAEANNG